MFHIYLRNYLNNCIHGNREEAVCKGYYPENLCPLGYETEDDNWCIDLSQKYGNKCIKERPKMADCPDKY